MPSALLTMSRSQYAPKIIVLEQLRWFAVLCKQSEGPQSELEWRSKSHQNLWLERSRNQQMLTITVQWAWYLIFQVAFSVHRDRDFA